MKSADGLWFISVSLGSFARRKPGAAQLEVFLMGIEARVTWLMAVGSMWRWTDGCST
jgi:hypothetical protein